MPKDKNPSYGSYIDHRTSWLNIAKRKLPDLGNRSIIEYIKEEKPHIKDPSAFIASLFEEGMAARIANNPNFKRDAPLGHDANYPYSGALDFGLDTIGDNVDKFIKKGYLDSSIKDRMNTYQFTREDGNIGKSADFQNLSDVIDAKYAFMKESEDYIEKNYSDLSPKAKEFFTYVGYNAGLGRMKEMVESFDNKNYLENDKFLEDGFTPESWKNPYTYAMRRFQGADMMSNEIEDLRRKPKRTESEAIKTPDRKDPFDKPNRLNRRKEEEIKPPERNINTELSDIPLQSFINPKREEDYNFDQIQKPDIGLVEEEPVFSNFSEAFAANRKKLGAGQEFEWKGNRYTTNYAEEINPTNEQYAMGGLLTAGIAAAGLTGNLAGGVGGKALSGAATGASLGAKIGTAIPIPGVGTALGAGVGALAGGAMGYFRGRRENREMENLLQQQEEQRLTNVEDNRNSMLANLNYGFNNSSNLPMAYGGSMVNPLETPIGSFNDFPTGGTHESNPNGGIPQGTNLQGQMRTVEEGEGKFKFTEGDYIFSNRLTFE